MKTRTLLSLLLLAVFLLSSCTSNRDVAAESFIQKRKYRKGFHLNIGKRSPKEAYSEIAKVEENEINIHEPTPEPHRVVETNSDMDVETNKPLEFLVPKHSQQSVDHKSVIGQKIERLLVRPKSKNVLQAGQTDNDPRLPAILSLVFAGLALLTGISFIPLIPMIFGGLAIFFGHKAMALTDDEDVRLMAKIGRIIGLTCLILNAIVTLFFIGYFVFIILLIGL